MKVFKIMKDKNKGYINKKKLYKCSYTSIIIK